MSEAHTEVAEQKGGLPQLNLATYEEQIIWLIISFAVLFLIVSRAVLPRVTKVLEEREERIATDLDTAERLRKDAEEVKASYEAAVAEARRKAQELILGAKDAIQADIAKAQAELDAELGKKADEAEARIAKAKDEALAGISEIATGAAVDIMAKLAGVEGEDAAVAKAVETALASRKGA
ncbi:MAG: F0F1 ATP synthase subunit B' [Alphaproteobacteria bacterium]|nr:MAG: F0F1 ATP synthase subunit B' [Alphaproteobacteria bacterium]